MGTLYITSHTYEDVYVYLNICGIWIVVISAYLYGFHLFSSTKTFLCLFYDVAVFVQSFTDIVHGDRKEAKSSKPVYEQMQIRKIGSC